MESATGDGNVKLTIQDNVATILLARPKQRNALTMVMTDDLVRSLETAARSAEARVVVITGAGSAFCSGHDVNELMTLYSDSESSVVLPNAAGRVDGAIRSLPQPSLAIVNGPAMGMGCDIALMCDLIIASESACFSELFVRRGLVPSAGTWLLPRIVGLRRAAQLLLTGEVIDAREAREWGIVNWVAPDSQLSARAQEVVDRLCALPASTLRYTKRALRQSPDVSLDQLLEFVSFARSVDAKSGEAQKQGAAFLSARDV